MRQKTDHRIEADEEDSVRRQLECCKQQKMEGFKVGSESVLTQPIGEGWVVS